MKKGKIDYITIALFMIIVTLLFIAILLGKI